jgi:hypothetical protein
MSLIKSRRMSEMWFCRLEVFEDKLLSVVWMVYDAPTESVRSLNTTFESL